MKEEKIEFAPLASEIIGGYQETLADIEIALNKARLMVEEILDNTEPGKGSDDTNNALIFAAQRGLLNTQAQIAHDYLVEMQSLIDTLQDNDCYVNSKN